MISLDHLNLNQRRAVEWGKWPSSGYCRPRLWQDRSLDPQTGSLAPRERRSIRAGLDIYKQGSRRDEGAGKSTHR